LTVRQLYLDSWEAQKIINIPVEDALRKGYQITGIDAKKAQLLGKEELRLGIRDLLRNCLIYERIDGGAFLFIGYEGDEKNVSFPPKKNGKIKFLRIYARSQIAVFSNYNIPSIEEIKYEFRLNGTLINEDRLIIFKGAGAPVDPILNPLFSQSILWPIKEDILYAIRIRKEVYELSKKASCIMGVLKNYIGSDEQKLEQFKNTLKNMCNDKVIILNGEDAQLENFTTNFGALPELINTYLKVLASAADVPVTRFLGISNSGLTQSADGDLENYYNSLNRLQTHIGKAVKRITQILYLNLFGYDKEYDKIEVVFPPLWNLSDEEEEKIKSAKLEKIMKAEERGLMNVDEAIAEINEEKIFTQKLSTKDLDLDLDPEDEAEDSGD
jgi:phage-related protein (TIGR01555 family)